MRGAKIMKFFFQSSIEWPEIDVQKVFNFIITYGLRIIYALIILFVGRKLIKWLIKRINKHLDKSHVDTSLKTFLAPLINITLNILLVLSLIGMFGIEVTSFVAILGAISLSVGLAFQGSLANFAGGVLILVLKPFRVGDFIETSAYSGTVKEIRIFYTILTTVDNRKVIIPNANLSNASLINHSSYPYRRLEMKFSFTMDNDINKVKSVIEQIINEQDFVLKEPAPSIFFSDMNQKKINISVYVWVNNQDMLKVQDELMFKFKEAFDREGLILA